MVSVKTLPVSPAPPVVFPHKNAGLENLQTGFLKIIYTENAILNRKVMAYCKGLYITGGF